MRCASLKTATPAQRRSSSLSATPARSRLLEEGRVVLPAHAHVRDDRLPARQVDAVGAGLEDARLDVLGHRDELGHDVGGRAVGRDAASRELAQDAQALGRARDLDHDVGALGGDLEALAEHRVRVEGATRVDLSGEVAEAPAGRVEERPQALGAELDEVQVERPEDLLDVGAGVGRPGSRRSRLVQRSGSSRMAASESGGLVVPPRKSVRAGSSGSQRRRSSSVTRSRSAGGAASIIWARQVSKTSGDESHQTSRSGLVAAKRSMRVGAARPCARRRGHVEAVIGGPLRAAAAGSGSGVRATTWSVHRVQAVLVDAARAWLRRASRTGPGRSSRSRPSSDDGPRACRRCGRRPRRCPPSGSCGTSRETCSRCSPR